MASDRRVLGVAAIAMVLFVTVGVVSASVFASSACREIAGTTVATSDVVLEDNDPALPADVAATIDTLAQLWGQPGGIIAVDQHTRIAPIDTERLAFLGARTVVVSNHGQAAASFAEPTQIVGDGTTLYAVALVNELTGQIDAFQPLDAALAAGSCMDTAVVSEPLAFTLDAYGGDLALLRIEEDGSEPTVELRGSETRHWRTPIDTPTAPAGVLGERVHAVVGPNAVVVGQRLRPDDTAPAVVALDRDTGTPRWQRTRTDLDIAADHTVWVLIAAVGNDTAVIVVTAEAANETVLIAVDVATGETRWRQPFDAVVRDVAVVADGTLVVTDDDIVHIGNDGTITTRHVADAPTSGIAVTDDGWLFATATSMVDGVTEIALDTTARVVDVSVAHGRHAVVLAADDGSQFGVWFDGDRR